MKNIQDDLGRWVLLAVSNVVYLVYHRQASLTNEFRLFTYNMFHVLINKLFLEYRSLVLSAVPCLLCNHPRLLVCHLERQIPSSCKTPNTQNMPHSCTYAKLAT